MSIVDYPNFQFSRLFLGFRWNVKKQTEDNQEFVQNLHNLQIKDKNVDNQIELNCCLILTKSLELLIINKNVQSIKAFDKCIENVDDLKEFLSDSEISGKNTLLQRAAKNKQKQCAFFLLERMLNKSNLYPELDLVTFFGFGNEDQLLEALKTSTELIHIVATGGNLSLLQNLIDQEREANINATDTQGRTPLHLSSKYGYTDVAEFFIFNNGNIEAEDNEQKTPLHLASEAGQDDVIKVLITKNANIHALDNYDRTPLHLACKAEVAELLIANNANIEAKGYKQKTPLHLASEAGHDEVVKVLIAKKADINALDEDDRTPLHHAAKKGHVKVIEAAIILLNKNPEVINVPDNQGYTPLHNAACKGHYNICELLLEKGANIETKDHYKRTPLHLASEAGQEEMVKVLIAKNANINALDEDKRTPLHHAAKKGHVKVIEVLLDNGAKTDLKDNNGDTPLKYLCWRGEGSQNHVEAAKILLNKNPEVINVPYIRGDTPLHSAAWKGHYNICELLLEKGASKDIINKDGRTPEQEAKDWKHYEVANLIRDYPNHTKK